MEFMMKWIRSTIYQIFHFYYSGFTQMTLGKKLWAIIFLKLFIILVVLRFVFYDQSKFHTLPEAEKAQTIQQLLGESPRRDL